MPEEKLYIYTIQNKINLKIYVGQTEVNPKTRWYQHRCEAKRGTCYIHKALFKYGLENFSFTVIEEHSTQEDTDDAEKFWIAFFQSNKREFGYNLTSGGKNKFNITQEVKNKISSTMFKSGENHPNAKLNPEKALKIFDIYRTGKYTQQEVADMFGISSITVKSIHEGTRWNHITNAKTVPYDKTKFFGENHPGAKLTSNQALKIVNLYKSEKYTKGEIAKLLNIPKYLVYSVLSGQNWNHITHVNNEDGISSIKNLGKNTNGENHYNAQLTTTQVFKIVELYNTNNYTQQKLATMFNVSRPSISDILLGNTWRHITNIKNNCDEKRNIGELNNKSKLNSEKVLKIIELYSTEKYSQRKLAALYQVDKSTIGAVLNGETWSHITGIKKSK